MLVVVLVVLAAPTDSVTTDVSSLVDTVPRMSLDTSSSSRKSSSSLTESVSKSGPALSENSYGTSCRASRAVAVVIGQSAAVGIDITEIGASRPLTSGENSGCVDDDGGLDKSA